MKDLLRIWGIRVFFLWGIRVNLVGEFDRLKFDFINFFEVDWFFVLIFEGGGDGRFFGLILLLIGDGFWEWIGFISRERRE